MMGRISQDQGQLFYSFCLEEVVPDDHLVRGIASVLDLSWVRAELAPHYSHADDDAAVAAAAAGCAARFSYRVIAKHAALNDQQFSGAY